MSDSSVDEIIIPDEPIIADSPIAES